MHSKYMRLSSLFLHSDSWKMEWNGVEGGIIQMIAFENALLDVSERVISLMISNTIFRLISCVRCVRIISDFFLSFIFASHSFHFTEKKRNEEIVCGGKIGGQVKTAPLIAHIANRSKQHLTFHSSCAFL